MSKIRVLLVDDEEDLSLVLAERLEMKGFVSRGVVSADEALKLIDSDEFDVMIIDIKMPGISGLDLMHRVKQKRPATQVILFTGHGSEKEGAAAINDGAYDYLIKPIKIEDLIDKINKAVANAQHSG
jgi:two-component system, OmpR family, response regulator